MLIKETNQQEKMTLPTEAEGQASTVKDEEKLLIQKERLEIKTMQRELKAKSDSLDELAGFFSNWAKAFESIIQTPVNLDNEEHVRIHYSSMRNSARNLVDSCRKKIEEFEAENK
jgi:hypothetical protein